jgi:hypothetical protein
MKLLGIQLQLMMGPEIPVPAPRPVSDALQSVEVIHSDNSRSGFQMTFGISRNGAGGMPGEALMQSPLFEVFSRIVLTVNFQGAPTVLMDGFITLQQYHPGEDTGTATLTLTGEDVSLMMDREEKCVEHPAQSESTIVLKTIGNYAKFGLVASVVPPRFMDVPSVSERIPVQVGTDLEYVQALAKRHAYIFNVTPGPAPLTNTAYWGPPIREGLPQKALSVNMGPHSNVDTIKFEHNALKPKTVSGKIKDRVANETATVQATATTRSPQASASDIQTYRRHIRKILFRETGLTRAQADARAQAMVDESVDQVVTATGELDAMRYGGLLQPRKLVGLRGAGSQYNGLFYVQEVKHQLSRGSYRQSFTLTREGLGSTVKEVKI